MSDFMKGLIDGSELSKLEEEQRKALSEINSESNSLTVGDITEAKQPKWEPAEWRPEYQMIVTLSLMNFDGAQIVEIMDEKYNYHVSRQHVYNILNSTRGKEIIAGATEKVVQVTEKTVEEMLSKAETLAAQRVVQVLEDDSLFMKNAFAVFDRAAKVLEGRGKLRRDINDFAKNQNNQNNFYFANLPEEVQKRIDRGLNRVALVEELHGPSKDSGNNREGEQRSGTDG